MGLLNDMKKLLFGAKSVGKHTVEKAVEAGKEAGAEWKERTETLLDQAQDAGKDIAAQAGAFAQRTAKSVEDLFDSEPEEVSSTSQKKESNTQAPIPPPPGPEDFEHVSVPPPPGPDTKRGALDFSTIDHPDELELKPLEKSTFEKVGGKVLDTTLEAGKKVEHAAEEIGHKVLDAGEIAAEKFKETAEQVGAKVIEKGGEFLERAKEFGSHLLHKAEEAAKKAQEERAKEGPGTLDQLIQKAKDLGEKLDEKASDKNRQFTDSLKDAKANDLNKHDDFFEKARRFADGDHHATSKTPQITRDPNFKPADKKGKTLGFDDVDGDGDDLIDDAIVDKP